MTREPGSPSDRLLPDGQPNAGLICEYEASQDDRTTVLLHSVVLNAANARKLAIAVNHLSLKPPAGIFHCPADSYGSATVIALAYQTNRTADLWYATSGCRTLDNGDVSAFQGANPSFYNGFQDTFNSLVPAPAP